MKRHLSPVLFLALILILPVLTGCPPDAGDDTQNDTPSDVLVLKGTVYEEDRDQDGKDVYVKYTTADTVGTDSFEFKLLGEAPLTDGEFTARVGKPDDDNLGPATGYLSFLSDFSEWKDPKIEPADTKGIVLSSLRLKTAGRFISKEVTTQDSGNWNAGESRWEYVDYFYVDKDATITLEEQKDNDDSNDSSTYKAATLQLKKGWNPIHWVYNSTWTSPEGQGRQGTSTTSVAVEDADLKWVIE
jgi:hypothetical protein